MGSVTDRPRRVVTRLLRRRTRGEPSDHARTEPPGHTRSDPPNQTRVGAPPSPPPADQAGDAELDTLRGELVRELDRLASDAGGSAAFRRI